MRQASVTPSQAAALVYGYRAGARIGELAEQAGLHRQTVIRHLVHVRIELPQRGLTDEQTHTAAELYVDGLTLVEVGARLGVVHIAPADLELSGSYEALGDVLYLSC